MKLSYTFLSNYRKCRRRAYLQYVKKVVPYDKVNHRPFIVGICADWLFKKWVTGGYTKNWMIGQAEGIYNWFEKKKNIQYLAPDDKGKLIHKLKVAVTDLEEAAYVERFPERELQMQTEVGRVIAGQEFIGKLDIWFPKESAIYDLKITSSMKYLDNFQLEFFAWLMETNSPIRVERLAFLSPLMRPHLKEVEWNASIKVDLESSVMADLELIKEEHWEITAKDCWGCPVHQFCEDVSDVQVKRNKTEGGGFSLDLGGSDGSIEEEL